MLAELEDSCRGFGPDIVTKAKAITEQLRVDQRHGVLPSVDASLNQLLALTEDIHKDCIPESGLNDALSSAAAVGGQRHPIIVIPTGGPPDSRPDAGVDGGSERSSLSSTGNWVDGQPSPIYQPEEIKSGKEAVTAAATTSPPAIGIVLPEMAAMFLQQPAAATVSLDELLHPATSSTDDMRGWDDMCGWDDPGSASIATAFTEDFARDGSAGERQQRVLSPRSPSDAVLVSRSIIVPVQDMAPNLKPNPLFDLS